MNQKTENGKLIKIPRSGSLKQKTKNKVTVI